MFIVWDDRLSDLDRGVLERNLAADQPTAASVSHVRQRIPVRNGALMGRLRNWALNKAADQLDHINGTDTNWCSRRTDGGRCCLPSSLDSTATERAGRAVWVITDRGACERSRWDQQMACDLSTKRDDR